MQFDMKAIGKQLKLLRGDRTLEEVAKKTNIGRSALNMYELGLRMPRDEAKIKLANFYGTTVDELFFNQKLHEA